MMPDFDRLGAEPETPMEFEEQPRPALTDLAKTVERAGGTSETILRVNAYLADIDTPKAFDRLYRDVIGLEAWPARRAIATTIDHELGE